MRRHAILHKEIQLIDRKYVQSKIELIPNFGKLSDVIDWTRSHIGTHMLYLPTKYFEP